MKILMSMAPKWVYLKIIFQKFQSKCINGPKIFFSPKTFVDPKIFVVHQNLLGQKEVIISLANKLGWTYEISSAEKPIKVLLGQK